MDPQIQQILDWSGEPEQAARDFSTFLNTYETSAGQAFDLDSVNAKRLLSIFGNSNFLTHFLLRHPLEADLLLESPCIETDKKIDDYREDLSLWIPEFKELSLNDFGKKLRHYKYREFLRLTVKDLSQAAALENLLLEISDLAIAISEISFQYFHAQLCKEHGQPIGGFSIIA